MVLNDLARLAALIRKAGTSSRLFRADATFDPRMQKHGELRQHLIQLLLCRPSQLEDRRHAHWDSIDPSLTNMPLEGRDAYWNRLDQERVDLSHVNNELTDIQERLVVANLRRSHRFAYSQKHGSKLESSSQPFKPIINMIQTGLTAESPMSKWDMPTGPKPGAVNEPAQMHSDQMGTPDYGAENMTDTVASDVETAVIKDVEKKPTPSQQAATEISTTGSRLRYPKPPRCKPGLVLFTCPCCCLPLPMIFADSRRWRYVSWDAISTEMFELTYGSGSTSKRTSYLTHVYYQIVPNQLHYLLRRARGWTTCSTIMKPPSPGSATSAAIPRLTLSKLTSSNI